MSASQVEVNLSADPISPTSLAGPTYYRAAFLGHSEVFHSQQYLPRYGLNQRRALIGRSERTTHSGKAVQLVEVKQMMTGDGVRVPVQDEHQEHVGGLALDENMLVRRSRHVPDVRYVARGEVVPAEILRGNVVEVRPESRRAVPRPDRVSPVGAPSWPCTHPRSASSLDQNVVLISPGRERVCPSGAGAARWPPLGVSGSRQGRWSTTERDVLPLAGVPDRGKSGYHATDQLRPAYR